MYDSIPYDHILCLYIYIYIHTYNCSISLAKQKPDRPQEVFHSCSQRYDDISNNACTRSPLEGSRLFGPSPWKILATSCETWNKWFLSNPAPGENLLSGNIVMETGCILWYYVSITVTIITITIITITIIIITLSIITITIIISLLEKESEAFPPCFLCTLQTRAADSCWKTRATIMMIIMIIIIIIMIIMIININ